MKIERHMDAKRLNEILNDPVVRPDVADLGDGVLDLTYQISDERNILLVGENGACLFLWVMSCLYEVHTQILPTGRGRWAKEFVQACGEWMFTKSDAMEIITRVPQGHVAAKTLTMLAGGKYEFTRQDFCLFRGKNCPVDIYSCRLQDWMTTAPHMQEVGEEFHKHLHAEADRLGIKERPHESDANHNQYVGACIKMFQGGQKIKAVTFYNRWAVASRHETVAFVADDETPVIKFDIGYLLIKGNSISDIEVKR